MFSQRGRPRPDARRGERPFRRKTAGIRADAGPKRSLHLRPELGKGGMADTRDPEPFVNESDKRQSISQAPSFEEYLKSRAAE